MSLSMPVYFKDRDPNLELPPIYSGENESPEQFICACMNFLAFLSKPKKWGGMSIGGAPLPAGAEESIYGVNSMPQLQQAHPEACTCQQQKERGSAQHLQVHAPESPAKDK